MVRAITEHRRPVLDAPDADVLVWSDPHLGHANIIEYQDRPLLDAEDMNAEIWERGPVNTAEPGGTCTRIRRRRPCPLRALQPSLFSDP